MATSWRLGMALLGGGALALAFSPVDQWWLAPLAIMVLVLVIAEGTRGTSIRRSIALGALMGAIFGFAFFAVLTPWLRVIGPDAYALIVTLSLAFTALFAAGTALLLRLPGWPLWVACWWISVELLRSTIPFGGFPWGRLGHSQVDAPTAAWVTVGGVPALGFVVALLGTLAAAAVISGVHRQWRHVGFLGVAAVLMLASGLFLPTPTAGREVTVAVVQGSVPDTGMDAFGRRQAVLDAHLTATHQLAEDVRAGVVDAPDFVVWPENASDIDPTLNDAAFASISAAVADVGVPVLVGLVVEVEGGARVANQGTVWDPVEGPGDTYIKQHLVPFGEYVPLRDLLQRFISRLDRIPRDFAPGDQPGVLPIGPTTVADVICFDVAYDAAVRDAVAAGGEVITVQTNNATYGATGQIDQQWAISRLRALEHGRTVVVASTSGISGVIAPNGDVIARAPENVPAVIVETIDARTDQTLATSFGAWPGRLISLLGWGALAASVFVIRRSHGKIEA